MIYYQPLPHFDVLQKKIRGEFYPLTAGTQLVVNGDIVIGWNDHEFVRPLFDAWGYKVMHDLNSHHTTVTNDAVLNRLGVHRYLPENAPSNPA